jgi:hypothetical protein
MLRTFEAIFEADGRVRLLEPISVPTGTRALVTILDKPADVSAFSDWNREEEDAAWQSFQEPPRTGAELVAYWEREGIIGSRPDITDPVAHSRRVRAAAEDRKHRDRRPT